MNRFIKTLSGLGEVELVDFMGGDTTVVNSARVSYGKRIDSLQEKDKRLLKFLWDNGHTSPFRHCTIQFRVLAPIFVLRQWMKHQVGCAWNERSGRYTEFEDQYYEPSVYFESDPSIKQGKHTPMEDSQGVDQLFKDSMEDAFSNYQALLMAGVSKEQARAILPVGMLSECYWTCSLHALLHFLELRLDEHSQYETRLFAKEIYELVRQTKSFEVSLDMWKEKFLSSRPEFDFNL
jgi:thymidylate synthase (FAD)